MFPRVLSIDFLICLHEYKGKSSSMVAFFIEYEELISSFKEKLSNIYLTSPTWQSNSLVVRRSRTIKFRIFRKEVRHCTVSFWFMKNFDNRLSITQPMVVINYVTSPNSHMWHIMINIYVCWVGGSYNEPVYSFENAVLIIIHCINMAHPHFIKTRLYS